MVFYAKKIRCFIFASICAWCGLNYFLGADWIFLANDFIKVGGAFVAEEFLLYSGLWALNN